MEWTRPLLLGTFEGVRCVCSMRIARSLTALALALPLACSAPATSSEKSPTPSEEADDAYSAPTTISGPGISVGSGEIVETCSLRDAQLGVGISGALQLNADTSGYGCYGTRSLEGDQLNPSVNAILADGRALDINLFIDDSELDHTDAPTTVDIWARERPLVFGAYSESWKGEACSTSYQIEDLDVSGDYRKTYRVQGSTTCTSAFVGDNAGHKPTDPTVTLERFDFVGFVAWFDRSLL
ncbi:MAG TPA: hypothetical protein VGC79_15360 [Polyangiaceae bacterium]